MIRGIYTAASGLLANQKRLDVVANNLANASTTGFKRDTVTTQAFSQLLLSRMNDFDQQGQSQVTPIGPLGLGTYAARTTTRLVNGPLVATGNALDVAIMGDGFFTVQTPQGVRYTRQGNFMQDSAGILVTPEGYPVLVNGGPVIALGGPLTIDDKGEVRSGSESLGQLTITTSQELGALRKEGSGYWVQAGAPDEAMLVTPAETSGSFQLRAGYLEASNVETVSEMVEMMTTMRSFEANQKLMQVQDETLQKAVTEVGRVG